MANVATSPDFVTIATNAGVFFATVGTVIAAIWSAVKKIKTVGPDQPPTSKQIIGATILENVTLLMWSESNRDVVEALGDHQKEMMELRFAITRLVDKTK